MRNTGVYSALSFILVCSLHSEAIISSSAPNEVTIMGEMFVEQGEELNLTCTAQGGPDNTHVWSLDGEKIEESQVISITTQTTSASSSSVLSISRIDAASHQGTYTCNVTNTAGSDEGNQTVTVSPNGIVSSTPMIVIASRGDNVTLTCHTDAGPDTMYVWIYNGSNLVCTQSNCSDDFFTFNATDGEILNATQTFSPVLNLYNVNAPENGGEYVCAAINNAGIGLSFSYLNFIPELVKQPQELTANSFETGLSMTCEVEAFPYPEYQWQRREQNDFTDQVGEESSTIDFGPISFMNAGVYRCLASNVINETVNSVESETATLFVSPTNGVTTSGQPSENVNGGVLLVEQEDQFNITCTAEGGPNNTYEWRLGGQLLEDNNAFTIFTVSGDRGSTSILRVVDVDAATHKGIYLCRVQNDAGNDQTTFEVKVSPNGIVATTPENVIATRNDNITFNCETEASTLDAAYLWIVNASNLVCTQSNCSDRIFIFNATDEELLNATVSHDSTLQLNGVTAANGGEYTCFIINDAGIGISSSNLYILLEFTVQPEDKEVNFTDEAVLLCDAESFPNFDLQWQILDNGEFVDIPEEKSGMLVFEKALLSDSGVYRCVVSNVINGTTHMIESRNATLKVSPISPNGSVSLTGPSFVSQEEQIVFNCTTEGGPNNTYIWTKNGVVIEDDDQHDIETTVLDTFSRSVLTVISVDAASDKGTYRCEVSNVGGTGEDSLVVTVSPEGIVSTEPVSFTASRGDNVTFTCDTEAGPNTMYLWLYNVSNIVCTQSNCSDGFFTFNATDEEILNATLTTSRVLTLTDVNAPQNGGEYICAIVNDAGFGLSTSTLYFEPQFIEEPIDIEANSLLDTVSLTCRAESFPYPTYQWQKRVSGVFEDIAGETNEVFIEDDAEHNDAGVYRCVVTNNINNTINTITSREATIFVTPNSSVMLSVSSTGEFDGRNVYIEQEGEFNITCMAAGGPENSHFWRLNGDQIKDDDIFSISSFINDSMSVSILSVSSVDAASHKGSYVCEVINEAGDHASGLTVHVSPEGIVSTEPVSFTASRGDNVTFTCDTEAGPNTMYLWLYNVSNIVCTQSNCSDGIFTFNATDEEILNATLTTSRVLTLTDVNAPQNGGEYICATVNDAGIGLSTSTLYFEPQFIEEPIDIEANSSLSLTCRADSFPYPTYQWQKRVSGMFQDIAGETNELFSIKNETDAGVYHCVVTNTINNTVNTVTSMNATIYVPPRIFMHPQSDNISIEIEDITLNCSGGGFPFPSITWFHNSTKIEENYRTNTTTVILLNIPNQAEDFRIVVSVLIIKRADVNDSGLYQCAADTIIAKNFSAVSDEALVLVQDVPQAPHSLGVEDVFSRNLTLLWTIPYDNNAPILGYFVFYNNPSFNDEGSTVTLSVDDNVDNLEIQNLHPGEFYDFYVVAFNEEGNSTQSDPYQVRTLEEAPDGPPQSVRGMPLSETEISLSWGPPMVQNRLGIIVSYDVMFIAQDMDGTIIAPNNKNEIGDTQTVLSELLEYTNYSISVRARTAEGPGPYSVRMIIILTDQSLPGPVATPCTGTVDSTNAIIRWSPPENPNGIIESYNVEVEPVRFVEDPFESLRKRRQAEADVLTCYRFLNKEPLTNLLVFGTEVNVSLIPSTEFQVRVSANTAIGSGNFSDSQFFSSLRDVPGVVVNFTGTTQDATSVLLSWKSPPCPNGPIIGYYVYYRRVNYTQSMPIESAGYSVFMTFSRDTSVSTVIKGFSLAETYAFHVRALSSNSSEPGLVNEEILITLISQVTLEETDLQAVTSRIKAGSRDLTIGLPSLLALESVGITNVQYYGVVVVPNPASDFMFSVNDFDETYPDLQPYENRGSNRYYIAAGWNNLSLVPADFNAGDKSRTTAFRNGVEESYLNAELQPLTTYCFYVLINHMTDVGNGVVTRYTELACEETERGYSLVGLVVGLVLVFLLLLFCAILICVLCCCYYRRKKQYVFKTKDKDIQEEPHYIICNPAFRTDKEKQAITLSDYPSYMEFMHSRNDFNFSEEFAVIEPQHTAKTTYSNANKTKNRYGSILAYDHSRVVLMDTSKDSNYINANHIEGFVTPSKFIATQAPMANTTVDFWSMIWEQEVTSIVMLTNLEENEKKKCYKYWPDISSGKEEYSSVEVKLNEESTDDSYTIRFFTIFKNGQEPRVVKQFHYTSLWDNQSATCHKLLDFIQIVKKSYTTSSGPMVVHCSTGAGRTGVFIATVAQIDRSEREQTIDIYNYVQYMRKQRPSMVLNEVEYIFIHDLLLKAIKLGMINGATANGSTITPSNDYEI